MPAPQVIRDLVARFREQQDSYRAETYSEAHLRQEFLNPLFEALGWDITSHSVGNLGLNKYVLRSPLDFCRSSLSVFGRKNAREY